MTPAVQQSTPLQGCTILLVEDEYFQAEDMAQGLTRAGAQLAGPHSTLQAAMGELRGNHAIDVAVLDINLRGQNVFPLGDVLAERGVPFVFATGYDRTVLPPGYQATKVLEKPFRLPQLVDMLSEICAERSSVA